MRFRYVNRTIVYFRLCNFFVFSLPIRMLLTMSHISVVKIIFRCYRYNLIFAGSMLLANSIPIQIY